MAARGAIGVHAYHLFLIANSGQGIVQDGATMMGRLNWRRSFGLARVPVIG